MLRMDPGRTTLELTPGNTIIQMEHDWGRRLDTTRGGAVDYSYSRMLFSPFPVLPHRTQLDAINGVVLPHP